MKIRSIKAAAGVIAGAVALAVLAASFFVHGWVWFTVLLAALTAFLTANYVIRKYVVFRIKPAYQILQARNTKTDEIDKQYKDRDVAIEIQGELQAWVERNSSEIARLKENEQFRKEFVGHVSHELKTPLCSIQGYILTLLDGGLEDPQINRKYLEQSQKNIDRLIRIILDLEDISRLETQMQGLSKETFNLLEAIQESVQAVEIQARQRNISLIVEGGTKTQLMVEANRTLIGQVFDNLLSNSIKYGKEGGRTRIRFVDMFDKILVEVQDNGIGVAPEHLPHLFERFYRVDKSRSRTAGGTGLGLAIVKHILEAHRESITVRSAPDEGTTFSFTLSKPA